jgi:hypothetical protein
MCPLSNFPGRGDCDAGLAGHWSSLVDDDVRLKLQDLLFGH